LLIECLWIDEVAVHTGEYIELAVDVKVIDLGGQPKKMTPNCNNYVLKGSVIQCSTTCFRIRRLT
jgi:hypothetical protein